MLMALLTLLASGAERLTVSPRKVVFRDDTEHDKSPSLIVILIDWGASPSFPLGKCCPDGAPAV